MTDEQRTAVEDAAKAWATSVGLPYFDTRVTFNLAPLVGKLTLEGMTAYRIVPIKIEGKKLTLAINEQTDRTQLDTLKTRLAATYDVEFNVISDIGWERIFHRFELGDNLGALEGQYENFQKRVESAEPKQQFNVIVQLAYQLGVSDIHLEPAAERARIRFRIDGALHPIIYLSKERYDLLTSDLQMRAGAKWGADEPQAGRIQVPLINSDGDIVPVNMRLETIPSLHGQDVVIRIFSFNVSFLRLDALDLTADQHTRLARTISHPRGLVLTVGPTGSGKTSSLYAIINQLNADDVKIVTLEDPVEYKMDGINQIQVNADVGLTFSGGLRSILRQDPDVVMVGEIRDKETAELAVQASLTGHLVFSTLHTNSAAGILPRLLDMGIEPFLIASTVHTVIGQRLVRRNGKMTETYQSDAADTAAVKETVGTLLPADLEKMAEAAADMGYESLPLAGDTAYTLTKGVDSPDTPNGYKGRMGVYEVFDVSEEIKSLILKRATSSEIQAQAQLEGMITMRQDGYFKALAGQTTLQEINRVASADSA